MDGAELDRHMMRNALRMAQRSLGRTAPNPAVGAVVVNPKTSQIIARAATAPGGRPHAEFQALAAAGAEARGATLYVTLEPCAHHGQTPPCADQIIESGIARVVAGVQDPDGRVAGRGLARLREAGLSVLSGVLGREARWLALGHILRVTENRPFVQLKLAVSRAGEVARGKGGQPTWVTAPIARAHGHLLRANADAILIGGGTLRDDDPELTCRLPGLSGHSPVRIVATNDIANLKASRLWATRHAPPLWLALGRASGTDVIDLTTATGCEAAEFEAAFDVDALLAALAAKGLTRLLVEGGAKIWRAFAGTGNVDEIVAFVADRDPHAPGERDEIRSLVQKQLGLDPGIAMDARPVGKDAMVSFRPGACEQ